MEFEDKGTIAFLFWLKWTLVWGVVLLVVGGGMAWNQTEIPYGILITYYLPYLAVGLWLLWSIGYVPARHFSLGYRYMISKCPACKASWVNEECPNCKNGKFLGCQCLVCGEDMTTDETCDECGTGNLKTFASNKS